VKVIGAPDLNGRDAIQAEFQKMFDGLSNMKNGATRVFVTKDGPTIVEWASNAKHTGDMHGMKATEKDVGFMGVSVVWFTPDGTQVKEEHVYHDMGTIMSQLGVSKQKARPIPTVPSGMPQIMTPGGADEAKNLDAANKMMGAFEKKSEGDFVGGLADNVEWDDMTQADTMKGKDSGKKFFKMMTTAFPDVKITDAKSWAVGDYVVMESALTGTHKGVLFGTIQPTKKSVNMHGVDIIQYKDGKAVHGWSYGNSGEMMAQLGLLPKIGARIEQVGKDPTGYDHNYVVNGEAGKLRLAAKLEDPTTGRVMETWTTEPGVQLYTGNFLNGKLTGIGGKPYVKHYALCLETQHYPDSPNHKEFPSVTLRPGQEYKSTTVYKFSVNK